MADDPVDISSMPDPGTIGLSAAAQTDPTVGMPAPADLYTAHYGSAPASQDLLDEFMKNPPQEKPMPSWRERASMLTGLPGAINKTVGGSVAGAVGFAGGAAPGIGAAIVDPANAAEHLEQAHEGATKGAAKLSDYYSNLTDSLSPWQTKRGKAAGEELAAAPANITGEVSDATLGKVLPDNAYQALKQVGKDVGTVAPVLGLPAAVRGVARGVGDFAGDVKGAVKNVKAEASGETTSNAAKAEAAKTDAMTPDVAAPVTGADLLSQPNPIPPPEGTQAAATGRARAAATAPAEPPPSTASPAPAEASPAQPAPAGEPTLPATDSAPQDMSLSPEQRAIVREGVAARRAASENEPTTIQSPGDAERGSTTLFRQPKNSGPQETPATPEEQVNNTAKLDALDKLSGGALPSRRVSAITGDYNATGNDWQAAKTGNEAAQRQLASESDALHKATDTVHDSVGSLSPDSVDPVTLGDRGRAVRGAIQQIEKHFNDGTDQMYDAARASNQGRAMPAPSRLSAYLSDDSNFTNDSEIGLQKAAQQRMQRLWTTGDPDKGTPPGSVNAAERLREFLNEKGKNPQAMGVAKDMKGHLDMDVAEQGGPGLFNTARAMRRHQFQMLEEPTGIKKLLAPSDSQGINHAIPEHKVMDYINELPREQHEQVMNVLRAGAHLGKGELADTSAGAIREIQAHTISRLHDAATDDGGKWNARSFASAATRYARNAESTFKERPDILRNIETVKDAGDVLHMDKSYPGAVGQAARSGILTGAVKGAGAIASSLAHEIPVVGRMVGRGIEGMAEGAAGGMSKAAAEKAFEQRTVDRNGKQRGSVQLFNDNPLNRKNEERTTFHGKDINPRNERSERTANQQMGGRKPLTDEQNDVIGRLMGGKQRGAVGDLSQRDAITHKSAPAQEEGVTNHLYGVPNKGGGMLVKEYPERGVSQVQTANVNDKGQGWGTRMLQRAADDAHARGQVLHSDKQVSEGQAGAYKNLASPLGYDVKMKDNDVRGGARHAVGDHVFEVRPPKGYEAPDELKNFIKKSAPAHKVDENGPSNWEDLKARRNEKVMPINPQGSEGSIYGEKANNIAFRAWHDKTHLDLNAGFDHDGELRTAQEQLRQAKAAGLSDESQKALWADTYETFKHHEQNGEFPKDPRQFVAQRMKDPTPLGARIPKQRGAVGDLNEEEAPRTAEEGSQINVGLHQGNEGDKGFRKMSKQEAQAAVESTGANVTKNTVLTPKQHGVSEPTSVMSTDRPLSDNEMQSVLAKTKQSAIPQRTGQGDTSMHVAPGHEARAKKEGWDQFNPDYFREHDGRTMTDSEANPAAPEPYPPRGDATVKDPKQSKFPGIYDDPKEIMQRLGDGQPESAHLKEIFGKDRKDLHDDAVARGDVESKTPIPGIAPKGKGSAHANNVTTPENAERIRNIISAYKEHDPDGYHGMVGWYEMGAMHDSIKKILGGNEKLADRVYHNLNSYTSYASPMSSVGPEITRGTAAATMAAEGNFDKFAKQGGLPNDKAPSALKAKNFELGNEGHAMHSTAHAGAMSRFNETGQEANAVKTGTYRRSGDAPEREGSDYQNTIPVGDSHWSRGVGLADVRGSKMFEGSAEGTEMKVLAPWYHDEIARHPDINLPSTSAQAVQWGALSKETGVNSPIGAPKLEIWADKIAEAAKREGIAPKAMWARIVKRLAK